MYFLYSSGGVTFNKCWITLSILNCYSPNFQGFILMKNAINNQVGMLGYMFFSLLANLKQGVIYFIKQALPPNISAGSVSLLPRTTDARWGNQLQKGFNPVVESRSDLNLVRMVDIHGLQTPSEKIAFIARPKIKSQSQIFRYGRSIFCLPHRSNFSDIFDLCLHQVSVVGAYHDSWTDLDILMYILRQIEVYERDLFVLKTW